MGKAVRAVAVVAVGIAIAAAAPYLAGSLLAALQISSAVALAATTAVIAGGLSLASPEAVMRFGAASYGGSPRPVWRLSMPPVKWPGHWWRYRPFMARGDCLGEAVPDSHYLLTDRKAEIRAGDIVVMQGAGVCGVKIFKRITTGKIEVAATNPPETLEIDLFKLEFCYRVRAIKPTRWGISMVAGLLVMRGFYALLPKLHGKFIAWMDSGEGVFEFAAWPHRQLFRGLEWVRDLFPAYDDRLGQRRS